MRNVTKKLWLAITTILASVCLLFGGVFAFSQTAKVKAASALETEFTNNGQFTVSKYNGAVPFEYVDGAAEGLPAGYTGSVLKITTTSDLAYANFDFSASQIKASEVENVVVRMYSPGYTSADEFRTNVAADGSQQVQYGAGAYDMSSWRDITLNATTMTTMTDANGYLAFVSAGVRVKSGASVYYIDSVTVNMKKDYAGEFTNNGQVVFTQYGGNTVEYVEGIAGSTGAVLKINTNLTSANGTAFINFSLPSVKAILLESIVVRIYSPEYTESDSFRAGLAANGSWVQNEAKDMSNWIDVPLSANAVALMKDADGFLSTPIPVGARVYSGAECYYIDSITVNVKEAVAVSFTSVNAWWNNNAYDNANCTFLLFDGGIPGNGSLDANFTDLLSKMTLDGEAVDTTNVKFYCPNWIGSSGGIVMRLATNPAAGSVLMLPAGAYFNIGGSDTNVYEISEDVYLKFDGSKWALTEKPSASVSVAQFVGPWGAAGDFNKASQVLLQYNTDATWNSTDKGTLATKVTYKNSMTGATYTATNNNISGWDGQKWIVFNSLAGYDVLEIAEGGTFGGVGIPALTLYQVNGYWVTTAPHAATTHFAYVASGWNNAVGSGVSNNIFSFDVKPLGDATDNTNLAATYNRTSLMVKYNGKTFAELYADANNANAKKYAISYAHGNQHFYFAIPEADLVEGATLEIEEGTPFMNNYLAATKLVLKGGTWQLPKADAEFNGIWGSMDTYNSAERVLLQYKGADAWTHTDEGDLASKVTYKNSTTGATRAATDADIAGWDGQKWIVFSNLAGYDVIEIAEGGSFGGGIGIPALTIYCVNGRWVTTAPHAATTNFAYIANGWNNAVGSGVSNNIFAFDVNPLGDANDATNLAATLNRTSLMVKYNGKTFAELYADTENANATKYAISYAHGNQYFYFAIPEADLVEGATIEIEEGTPFMNNYLGATTLTFKDGAWVTPTNYNPSFVSINSAFNNDTNGFFIVQFNTNGWAQAAVPTSWSGITYNGKDISTIASIRFYQAHSVWFTYKPGDEKFTSGYNRYSHPTIKFAEGATVVYEGETYTFQEMEFYLVDGKWTTEKPADWSDQLPMFISYTSIVWNNIDYDVGETIGKTNGKVILLAYSELIMDGAGEYSNYANLITADNDAGNKIKINGVPLKDVEDAHVCLHAGYIYINVPACEVLTIEEGAVLYGYKLSGNTFYFNGKWSETEPSYTAVSFSGLTWNN
ncbi:MAG: hypothetical protein J6S04_00345, partial [Clostridia bacterium]|nr:hypothetical protein [Clostridia bacterium]